MSEIFKRFKETELNLLHLCRASERLRFVQEVVRPVAVVKITKSKDTSNKVLDLLSSPGFSLDLAFPEEKYITAVLFFQVFLALRLVSLPTPTIDANLSRWSKPSSKPAMLE
ncbi:hypothetical protein HDU76_005519, partial [Blyttiomyces sp. JEL0837]